jgi:hypothetical protein
MLSSSNFICLGISNMLSDIVPIAILSQALLPDHRLNVEQLYLLHKGGLHTSSLQPMNSYVY